MHCQLCRAPLDAQGNHPPNNCPVYTQEPQAAQNQFAHYPTTTPPGVEPYDVPLWAQQIQLRLDQIQAQLGRIEHSHKLTHDHDPAIVPPFYHKDGLWYPAYREDWGLIFSEARAACQAFLHLYP